MDHQTLQQKYDELADAYREKSRNLAQTQKLYSVLKQKAQAEQLIAPAASKVVAQKLQSIDGGRRSEAFHAQSDLRQKTNLGATPSFPERANIQFGTAKGGLEQLHPHQGSGSSVVNSDQMLPPLSRLPAPRIGKRLTSVC
jgi:hypothetical protein